MIFIYLSIPLTTMLCGWIFMGHINKPLCPLTSKEKVKEMRSQRLQQERKVRLGHCHPSIVPCRTLRNTLTVFLHLAAGRSPFRLKDPLLPASGQYQFSTVNYHPSLWIPSCLTHLCKSFLP